MSKVTPDNIPASWKLVMDDSVVSRAVSRISYEIVERDRKLDNLAIVGIRTGGEFLAKRIVNRIREIEGVDPAFGVIDITLYRDDLTHSAEQPVLRGTKLPDITGARVVLVDDILFTGRTIRAALDAISDFGRPSCVELAVIADRGHREYPIRPDYIGKNIPTSNDEFVRLLLSERGFKDGLYLIKSVTGEAGEDK